MDRPLFNAAAALQFVVNGQAGHGDADATREAIEAGLRESGRTGTVHFAAPGELSRVARDAAAQARADGSAVVAVGGDGTINTVAQAAHAAGCTMGVIPRGTFNYFAREHGAPTETADALRWLLDARPEPVQISAINEQVFLVNASLGLYPDLLQDRETWKARFGRSRLVAFGAGMATLLRAQRRLKLSIEWDKELHEVRTLTLFVGNNRLQLEQLGLGDPGEQAEGAAADGHITAVILKPIGTLAMLGLMLRGALGQLGDASGIERIVCQSLVVQPRQLMRRRKVKVAFDGEVAWMTAPLNIRVLPHPLWLLRAAQ
ncbi:diacylglycerol kinase family protein [Hydrogenophaga sp.]|uniref:diacylglycerol/lipid kinase family protein n=1 Tax=Hydrogenophaga sp. TaxID=1904254 RepID=UPI002731439F|nr:diacylglycerol kinase family protein [Hydrogenophaga sp.]MDP2019106.1 diacylglycerol kinase family protein [Hydrogenophaga sp.]MDP3167847.1 diacylglycerol kinase family protein [Hydrogenophaga sp.]MDP3811570.1 diacylglycerol kinase family protein [Hydrogenophaga sp.]